MTPARQFHIDDDDDDGIHMPATDDAPHRSKQTPPGKHCRIACLDLPHTSAAGRRMHRHTAAAQGDGELWTPLDCTARRLDDVGTRSGIRIRGALSASTVKK